MLSFYNKNHCIALDRVQYCYLFNFEPKHFNILGYVFTRGCDHVEDFLSENQPFLGPVYMKVGDQVFSLNFSSEGMGRFMAGKAQDM